MTAHWTYPPQDGMGLESIPEGDCAQSLAGAGDGRMWFRVELDGVKADAEFVSSLFKEGEDCGWSKLKLVTKDWKQRPKSIIATVGVAFDVAKADKGMIPFIVGVEPRPLDDGGIQSSPCGARDGHLAYRDGRWSVQD